MALQAVAVSLTSTITPYDVDWPHGFAEASTTLAPVFSTALVAIHHVGSTAIPGLAAKPEVGILIVVAAIERVGS